MFKKIIDYDKYFYQTPFNTYIVSFDDWLLWYSVILALSIIKSKFFTYIFHFLKIDVSCLIMSKSVDYG